MVDLIRLIMYPKAFEVDVFEITPNSTTSKHTAPPTSMPALLYYTSFAIIDES